MKVGMGSLMKDIVEKKGKPESLAISIMPPLRDRGGAGRAGEKEGRKLWKCCAS